jgi:hypothetical protein
VIRQRCPAAAWQLRGRSRIRRERFVEGERSGISRLEYGFFEIRVHRV